MAGDLKPFLARLATGEKLTDTDAEAAFDVIMSGEATPAQIGALLMLALAPSPWLVVPYVMASQAVSGIAKDLTKMSSKSAVKLVVPEDAPDALFRWVAILTGSKNALKGVGFFLGGLLLTVVGFQPALGILAVLVGAALLLVLVAVHGQLGRPDAISSAALGMA